MATYTTQTAFESYVEGFTLSDAATLERLLQRAEKDVDRLLRKPLMLTNIMEGISITGTVTGGNFKLSQVWNGITYTTNPIPYNVDGPTLLTYLSTMSDSYGRAISSLYPGDTIWQIPEITYYSQPWAYGPLPGTPVVVEAYNQLGGQYLAPLTSDPSGLVGSSAGVTVTQLVRGGLRVNPYLMNGRDAEVLSNATCAQAEYRNEMGESFFRRAQWASIKGPDFQTNGKLPTIGPKVIREFIGSDLLQRGARGRPGTVVGRQITYVPPGGLPIPDDWRAP
jgi:hypothetical protein